jgi:intergrase/recombinase
MTDYPQLTEMGICNPMQIEKYMVNGQPTYDVLRIIYLRKKGSFLPSSRTYKFPRVQKEFSAEGKEGKTTTVMETNPGLRSAIDELKLLLDDKVQKQNVKKALREQISVLEEDIALCSSYMKQLIDRL